MEPKSSGLYYMIVDGKSIGPLTLQQVKERELLAGTMVCRNGDQKWSKVEDLDEFSEIILYAPPPINQLPNTTNDPRNENTIGADFRPRKNEFKSVLQEFKSWLKHNRIKYLLMLVPATALILSGVAMPYYWIYKNSSSYYEGELLAAKIMSYPNAVKYPDGFDAGMFKIYDKAYSDYLNKGIIKSDDGTTYLFIACAYILVGIILIILCFKFMSNQFLALGLRSKKVFLFLYSVFLIISTLAVYAGVFYVEVDERTSVLVGLAKSVNSIYLDKVKTEAKPNVSDSLVSRVVRIGNSIWMSENLNVSVFRNGDSIMRVKTPQEWERAFLNKQPAWCYYNNDPTNGTTYGKLYNWYAIIDPRGLAPIGWRIPSSADWSSILSSLGTDNGLKLKNSDGWLENGGGTNSSGFCAMPGGYISGIMGFSEKGKIGYWWSSDITNILDVEFAWCILLNYYNIQAEPTNVDKSFGLSVRCVQE